MNEKLKKQDEAAVSPAQHAESDAVKQARVNLSGVQKPAAYQSQWQQQLSDTMAKIQNRQPFSYDINGDALYDQYKNQYINAGKQAMEDTIGKAASMTGGYGNSYAVTAGNQAYQGYLGKLNDVIPELYQMALDRYNAEGDSLMQNYSLLADREEEDYARWRDSVGDYENERAYLTDILDRERDFDYGMWRDSVSDAHYADERAYARERDAVSDERYDNEWEYQEKRDAIEDWRYADEWAYTKSRDAVSDARYADETAYAREQDAYDRAMTLLKAGGEEETTKYAAYGNMSEEDFYDNLLELYYNYSNADGDELATSQALTAAKALLRRAGNTEEAKAAFRDYFGDEAYYSSMVYTDRMKQFEKTLGDESEYERRGINYDEYVMNAILNASDKGQLSDEEAVGLLEAHGLLERYNGYDE